MYAAEFDDLLYNRIAEQGLYSGKHGIIYAAVVEHGTTLTVFSVGKNSFIINAFGSENEPADTLIIDYAKKSYCSISTAESTEDFCITVKSDKSNTYYRLINDAFAISHTPPESSKPIAEYKNGNIRLYLKPYTIYSLIDSFKLQRINHISGNETELADTDKSEILKLLRACADIYEYDSEQSDDDSLMRKVLYTHQNFSSLTSTPLVSSEENESLKLCSAEYITSVLYNVFRKTAPRPAVNMLTEIGYCYNNGYYYYSGGYTDYFRTEVHDILKVFKTAENNLYIIFSDTYTENDNTLNEYSSAIIGKDKDGYFIKKLKMGDDFKNISSLTDTENENTFSFSQNFKKAVPFIIMLFTLAAVGAVIYFYIIRS